MKTKFHLAKRNPSRQSYSATPSSNQAVALVDERYLNWLAGQHGASPAKLHRPNLMPVLADLLRQGSSELHLHRAYLYSEILDQALVDDVVVRAVPAHAVDGGLALVRALGLELTQLALHGGCAGVLLLSDDERLIPYIDEAQWRGLKVTLVSDSATQDMGKLISEDPSWARLLMQADRRLSLDDAAWSVLTTEGAELPYSRFIPSPVQSNTGLHETDMPSAGYFNAMPSSDWRDQVQEVIRLWWAEETPDARLDLYEEMQNSQGVPPETDRHLLLRVRRELARTLSFQEKKTMRELIRATVLAEPPTVGESAAN